MLCDNFLFFEFRGTPENFSFFLALLLALEFVFVLRSRSFQTVFSLKVWFDPTRFRISKKISNINCCPFLLSFFFILCFLRNAKHNTTHAQNTNLKWLQQATLSMVFVIVSKIVASVRFRLFFPPSKELFFLFYLLFLFLFFPFLYVFQVFVLSSVRVFNSARIWNS